MKTKFTFIIIVLISCFSVHMLYAQQQPAQTVRGTVKDRESQAAVEFAAIAILKDTVLIKVTESDENGAFRLENIPVGRYNVQVKQVGFLPVKLSNIEVNAGKETVLNILMEGSVVTAKEVVVSAEAKNKGQVRNEMATVSVRSFTIEETNRYAGSRQDPARMASNYAGVQGANDSRNDIIIRGNSPMGLLYRLENVDIPNPNHFAIAGTTGGPVSILNNKVLANSDFMTGAFPSEYGNAIAGVFDLKMRNGNNEKFEHSFQFGILGTELASEGPISKKSGSSYLATYRYSTLKMLQGINVKIGTDAVPNYQDAAFRLNFPVKDKGNFSVFGIGGTSKIDIIMSDKKEPSQDLYAEDDRDQYFGSSMGVMGASYSHIINNTAFTKVTLSGSLQKSNAMHEFIYRNQNYELDSLRKILGYTFINNKTSLAWFINKKFGSRHTIKTGFYADRLGFDLVDSARVDIIGNWQHRWDYKGISYLLQPYVQYKYKFTDNFSVNGGLHSQLFTLNNSFSLEPRLGLQWAFAPNQVLSAGYGLHSQLQPTYIYFYHKPDAPEDRLHNKHLGFTRSHHYVLSYDNRISESVRLKAETYYQKLFDVPVDVYPSSFSLLNQGSAFVRFFPDSLVNKGTGENYGIELTVEKFFSKGYFFMVTGSLYESNYKGSDGVKRSTDFNGKYAANLLAGKEFKISERSAISLGTKVTVAGGRLYSPVDTAKSAKINEIVAVDALRNTLRFKDYFRMDLKIGYKLNTKRLTHEIAIDLVNIFNTRNVLALSYAPDARNPQANPVKEETQLGFLPLFYYKLDF